jgi:hypothetical protein
MESKSQKANFCTLNQLKDEMIGPTGTPARDEFEKELMLDIIRTKIREGRRQRKSSRKQSDE